jgi:adenylate kinase family enzyme
MHILVTGASGSGTSTVAAALAAATDARWLDADDYYWQPTDPPYQHKHEVEERGAALLEDLRSGPPKVVAGSVMGWGSELEDAFDLIVFLYLPADIRLARLKLREEHLFGQAKPEFLVWAAQYDAGTAGGRSLARHREWLAARTCPVVTIEGDVSTEARVMRVMRRLHASR